MHDVAIRNGTIIDGTGARPLAADIAVEGRHIRIVGRCKDRARVDIDATGLIVCPGFIDLHTHYDAQVSWDPYCSPSAQHGVTTVFGGNCGFTVAPMVTGDDSYLARLLAQVEGIPLDALESALTWRWTSFDEWLRTMSGNLAVNAGFLVGHSSLRRYAMGPAATARAATGAEMQRLVDVLRDSLAAGAIGFSSSWTPDHVDGDGAPVPSRAASAQELEVLASQLRDFPGTVLEFQPAVGGGLGADHVDAMTAMSRAAGRPINWNLLRAEHGDAVERNLNAADRAALSGARIVALTPTEPLTVRTSLSNGTVFRNLPGWHSLMSLTITERIRALSVQGTREQLRRSAAGAKGWLVDEIIRWDRLSVETAADPATVGKTLGEIGAETGRDAFDVLLDMSLSENLATTFLLTIGDDEHSWKKRVDLWRDPRTQIGGSDAGAHVDVLSGQSYTTSFLAKAVRELKLLPIEEAVHYLTGAPAEFYGLRGRGKVASGYIADLVVLDPATVAPSRVETRRDMPARAERLYTGARGIEYVFVGGELILDHGTETEARPGSVLRSGRDTF